MFGCFDQPDLKAEFGITVGASASWVVLSNMPTPAANAGVTNAGRLGRAQRLSCPHLLRAGSGGTATSMTGEHGGDIRFYGADVDNRAHHAAAAIVHEPLAGRLQGQR